MSGGPHANGGLDLRSPAFDGHTLIPGRYARGGGADAGGEPSPPLAWSGVPEGTAELAMLCEDPDAPHGTFTHWVLTGIPAEATSMAEGAVPDGAVAGRNGYAESGWGGPHPPVGDGSHRYFFRLFAVDRRLGLGPDATAEDVRAEVEGHVLSSGTLVGLFAR